MRIPWLPFGFLAGLILFSAGAQAHWVVPGLEAYWRFDGGSGTLAADSSGNGLVGTLAGIAGNTPDWIAGQFGGALEFDRAAAEHVRIGGNNAVTQLSGEKAFSFWTRLPGTGTGSNGFISIGKDNANRWYIDDADGSGRVRVLLSVGGVRSEPVVLTAPGVLTYGNDVWHHVVVTDTGVGAGGTSIYVDGVLAGSYNSFDYSGLPTDALLRLGGRYSSGVESMVGALDDVAVFSSALTSVHVNALYSLGREPGIQYNLGQVQGLFAAYATGVDARYGSLHWHYTAALDANGAALGQVTKLGDRYHLPLGDNGGGFVANAELIAHWTFDEASGAAVFDAAGVNHGSLQGAGSAPTRIEGALGGALRFDSSAAQSVLIGAENVVTALSNAKTFSCWMRLRTDATSNGILAIDNGTSANRWYVDDHSGAGHLRVYQMGGGADGVLFLAENALKYDRADWQHVVIADAGTGTGAARVYVNGRLAGTGNSFDYSGLPAESILRLGAVRHGDGYRYLKGDLDDVGIWRIALAEAQVLSLYEFAMAPGLGYDLGQVQQLFNLYQLGPDGGLLGLDGVHRWRYTDGLDFELGVLNRIGEHYFIQLDAAGSGLTTIPEPNAPALLVWTLAGLLAGRRRFGRRAPCPP